MALSLYAVIPLDRGVDRNKELRALRCMGALEFGLASVGCRCMYLLYLYALFFLPPTELLEQLIRCWRFIVSTTGLVYVLYPACSTHLRTLVQYVGTHVCRYGITSTINAIHLVLDKFSTPRIIPPPFELFPLLRAF